MKTSITITFEDDNRTVIVTDGRRTSTSTFNKITDEKEQAFIAIADFYGCEPIMQQREEPEAERKTLWVCSHCLSAITSREGNQATMTHFVDCDDPVESKCDWCEEDGFDVLYELV